MDFGLAQLTQASRLTRADQTMGTTAYMSPEQTQGSGVDHRSDIWSLGVVLHQMVTGQQPFKGDYDKAVMYSILNEEPEPITALRTGAPMELERIIGKCLAKSPENRYATVGDLSVDIVNLTQGLHSNALTTPRTPARAETRVAPDAGRPSLAWAAAVIFAALALTFGGLYWLDKTDAPGAAPMRFRVALPENARPSSFALSPDGQRLAYSFQDDLWIHDFSADSSARMGPASDQGAPFWSPMAVYWPLPRGAS